MSANIMPKAAPIAGEDGNIVESITEFEPAPDPYDCSEILRGLNVYHRPGDVVELRILGAGKKQTISGYFDDFKRLAKVTRRLANDPDVHKAGGIYFTLNRINSDLLCRARNRFERNVKTTTSDADVTHLNWLPVDLDPIRPKGISSTDEEHEAALDMAQKIRSELIELGWPEGAFVFGDSGNGAHLSIKIDLEPTGENVELVKRCLKSLDFIFSNEAVEVDTSTSNPARIWKLPGTLARKGDSSKERPHRMARILETPADKFEVLETVSRELLEGLASFLPQNEPTSYRFNSMSGEDFDPVRWAEDHGLEISKVKSWNGGVLVELEVCPFNPEHRRTARIIQLGNGAMHFGCFHNGCKGNDWYALRELLEPDRREGAANKPKTSETPITYEDRGDDGLIEITPKEGLLKLLSDCDGAVSKDGVGLSKLDAADLKEVIEKVKSGEGLTRKEEWSIYNKMKKYLNTQLAGFKLIQPKKNGDDQSSIATQLVDLALSSGATFWKSPDGEAFVTVPTETGHKENYPLTSKAAKTWLSGLLYYAEKKVPTGTAVADARRILVGVATHEGGTHQVFVRLAEYDGKFYLDLGGVDWRAVEVGPDGWRVISSEEVPVKFRRSKGILELPEPTRCGNLEALRRVLNIHKGSPWMLTQAWIFQAFKPTGPYPPLIVDGEQGSGKSWLGRILRYLIDPNKSPLRRPPRDERDLMIAATNSWLIVYDNLSGLPPWLGDALCVVSTGGGMSTRELYTDSDEALFDIQRPIILNGIDALTTRGDLLGRAILLHLPRIEDGARRTEKELKAELDRVRPEILGAIFDVVSHGLKELPNVKLESLPRMADFAEWVTACEGALGWEPGAFLQAFEDNRDEAKITLIENDMFATSLVEFILGGIEPFEGTAGFLLTTLEGRSQITPRNRPDGWPRSAQGTGNKLRRIIPALQAVGVDVSFRTGHGHTRLIRIERHTATKHNPTATTATKKTASCGGGGDGGVYLLTFASEGKKDEESVGGGIKNRKLTTPSPPRPLDNGSTAAGGGDGGSFWDDRVSVPKGAGELEGESSKPEGHQLITENLKEADQRGEEHAQKFATPPPKAMARKTFEDEGLVFGLSMPAWRELARRYKGLNSQVLMTEMGYDESKADMALNSLRDRRWVEDESGRLHPPSEEAAG